MRIVARTFLPLVMTATLASGCYFDVSTDSNKTDGTRTADELAGLITVQFAMKVDGATVEVVCPTGLTGTAGRQLTCTGKTSDGYNLEIAVLENGDGAFRWDIVKSVPVKS
jgi:hypothetical protein